MKRENWTKEQIDQHKKAARLLCEIKDEIFQLMRENKTITEYEVQDFIMARFKEKNLRTDPDTPIVAFRENTSYVHYFPEKESAIALKPNSLIMVDIWARLNEKNAPFADITWMAWYGDEIPEDVQKGFQTIISSRDNCLTYIKQALKTGIKLKNRELSRSMTRVVLDSGMQDFIPHGYGHSLGTTTCHGKKGRFLDNSKLFTLKNIAYTIEPGIYVENKFGFRSEIDFYIDDKGKLNVTTEVQKELVLI
jgi:Xaa-Pro aminopeptidase